MNLDKKDPPIIVIVGETASGKSSLALQLAQQFTGEIVSADATTVYKEFTIGTAKPTREDQALAPHHLIDIVEPAHAFNAAAFKQLAESKIKYISDKGRLPILVGGTGLYIDSLLFDYDFRKPYSKKYREELDSYSLEDLVSLAHQKKLNTQNVDTHNKRRLIRLIETNGQVGNKKPMRPNTLVLGLKISKEILRARIEQRLTYMLEQGLAQEVKTLSQKYDWDIEPMRAIGYREWQGYFPGEKSLEEVKKEIVTHTLQLAKKQRTWFKRNNEIIWVNNSSEAVAYTTTFLNK